ncbi:cytochrome P450 86B1 [Cinnamomum micranthum f. kanehirae]|uniref:Cytochrome P450 86B1 n=1 Tax=Cinnamomum micranthum f. kanehirae TaxID=337451 RepID=A0A443Q1Z6_9MAGN|nr:cytochrome P450 86B1 [Cinnamomum micranthum f. kanehirae]
MKEILAFLINGVMIHAKLPDMAMASLGLFAFSAIVQRVAFKGPMLWPVMGIIPTLFFHIHNIYDWITESLNNSGGTFHYRGMWMGGAHGVVTLDPGNIEYMLKTRFKNFPKGNYYRERFADFLGDGIFNTDDDAWKEQRRATTSEMHSKRFVNFSEKTMEELVNNKLLKLLEKLAKLKESVDLQDLLLRFTFDNICTAALGVDPGCLAFDLPEVPFAKAFEEATELTLFRFMVPPFLFKIMKLFELGPEKRLKEAIQVVHEFAAKMVTERRSKWKEFGGLDDRSDLLSRLIEGQYTPLQQSMNMNYQYSDEFLKDFCISFVLAGRDTSSVALAWFFWLLHIHPHVERQILSEIQLVIHNRNIKEPTSKIIFSVPELNKMDYLQAALSESLRLYPPVPVDFKEVVEDDVFPDGTPVKKGDRVFFSIFSMARSEAIWGKDCLEFKPERWIRDGRFASKSQFKYPVFNAGPRLCVGKKFAYMQMKMVAASILLRYSVSVVEGHVVVPKVTTTLYMKHGLKVTFKPRA